MGYQTTFDGEFKISPPLSVEVQRELNSFCGNAQDKIDELPGNPPHYGQCDWAFSTDGTSMCWNGMGKSYEMTRWAVYLHNEFFPDHDLDGRIHARGEEFNDIWTMVASSEQSLIFEEDGWDQCSNHLRTTKRQ